MASEERVVITVLGNSEGEICRGGWGPRRSSAETTELTRMYLKRFYSDRVTVEYHDMANPEQLEQHKNLLEKVPPDRFFYPFTFIDGELALVGSCDYYQVLYALRDVVEPVQK